MKVHALDLSRSSFFLFQRDLVACCLSHIFPRPSKNTKVIYIHNWPINECRAERGGIIACEMNFPGVSLNILLLSLWNPSSFSPFSQALIGAWNLPSGSAYKIFISISRVFFAHLNLRQSTEPKWLENYSFPAVFSSFFALYPGNSLPRKASSSCQQCWLFGVRVESIGYFGVQYVHLFIDYPINGNSANKQSERTSFRNLLRLVYDIFNSINHLYIASTWRRQYVLSSRLNVQINTLHCLCVFQPSSPSDQSLKIPPWLLIPPIVSLQLNQKYFRVALIACNFLC